jgi:hypothetical protein
MEIKSMMTGLFSDIDRKDTGSFLGYLTDDVLFRFGNMQEIRGKDNVAVAIQGFYDSIDSLSHKVDNIWDNDGIVVCNGTVTYTRHDSTILSVPFANIYRLSGDLISEYLIYADISELYK